MKKTILLLAAIISVMSCKKTQDFEPLAKPIANAVIESITATSVDSAFLYIPEDEGGWEGGKVGLFNAKKAIGYWTANQWVVDQYGGSVVNGVRYKKINYGCMIANGKPGDTWDTTENNPITRSGIRDFVVNSDGSESIPLQITTYAKGGVYLKRTKVEFDYSPTDKRLNAAPPLNYTGKDYANWGYGDMYYNDAIVPEEDGYYVIAVQLGYGNKTINPIVSLLPIHVIGNTVVTDTTAIALNAALPATNKKAVIQRGKLKGINISWEGTGYAWCIERSNDGGATWTMFAKWLNVKNYFDPLGSKSSLYRITTRNEGRIPDYVPTSNDVFKVSTR